MPRNEADVRPAIGWAAVVIALGAATAGAALTSELAFARGRMVVAADLAAGFSFAGVGAALWIRYPGSRVGMVTIGVGLASFLPDIRWFGSDVAWTVVYFGVLAVVGQVFEDRVGCDVCPSDVLAIRSDPALSDTIWTVAQLLNLLIVGAVVGLIVRQWRGASPVRRRSLAPVMWGLGPISLGLAARTSKNGEFPNPSHDPDAST
jgi:hypothetical protein